MLRGLTPKGFRYALCVILAFAPYLPLAHAAPCLQSPEGLSCPACNCDNSQQTTGRCDSCCPTPKGSDYTCQNQAVAAFVQGNLRQCVSCDIIVREANACRPGNECPRTTCPPGEHLINPNQKTCYCQKLNDFCSNVGDVQKFASRTYHPNSIPTSETMESFMTMGPQGTLQGITSTNALKLASPCMEQIRDNCAKKFVGGFDFGLFSYRYLDTDKGKMTVRDQANFNRWLTTVRNSGNTSSEAELFRVHIAPALNYLDSCIQASLTVGQYSRESDWSSGVGNGWKSSSVYLQADCRPVEKWKQGLLELCPNLDIGTYFNAYTSPVSLLWGEDTKIKDSTSRSKFPLNPKEAGKWFIWKASGKTPLVVWDPEGKGIIMHARQLFGNYTFDKEWKNGYEALASLDKDRNGWLEGEELKGIALWFDFNQDGTSDRGEVKTLSEVGVYSIGTTISQRDEKNGHIFADQGYKRKVGNKVIEGRSVDWFSQSLEGKFGMEALYEGSKPAPVVNTSSQTDSKDSKSREISGMWDWSIVDLSQEELPENMPQGSLMLIVTDGNVSGTSYVTQQTAPNKSGIGEEVIANRVTGEVSNLHGKNPGISFKTFTPNGGKVESKAVLSDDGTLLYGETVEEAGPNRDRIRYAWIARRYNGIL